MRAKIIIPLIFAVVSVAGFGYFFLIKDNQQSPAENTSNLLSQTDGQAGISFKVKPLDFNSENPVKFEIEIDAHAGSLDFDLTEISILEDDKENKYQPLDWQGTPPGGHHLAGILSFPKINNQAKTIKLTVQDAYLRIFEWRLE